ncbi:hypothetical protein [Polaromonas sp.]|uniref:hypothetical protein n=1 Tax=Polaromonas sp. TaxID=1869339 RepID=UPI003CC21F06
MPFLGKAAVAMWWNMAPEHREEFEDWHSHEHFPERMAIPGFLRGSRWAHADGGERFFVMYELDDYATLTSSTYRERLNNPTPWSTQMMPRHQGMVRSQCRVLHSAGGGISRFALTLRLSPAEGRETALQNHLAEAATTFTTQPGGAALHLLATQTPDTPPTLEQQIRGGKDAAADWIVVAMSYAAEALEALQRGALSQAQMLAHGARPGGITGMYQLSYTLAAQDLR